MKRLSWADSHPLLTEYYDQEWGTGLDDEAYLFELLVLESFQSGLSWLTILKKRKIMQNAFNQFDIDEIKSYDKEKIEKILDIDGMIKHRGKIESVQSNAYAFLNVQNEFGTFKDYLLSFTDGKIIANHIADESEIETQNDLTLLMSKDMKKRGFKFIGPVTLYTYLCAIGLIQNRLVLREFK